MLAGSWNSPYSNTCWYPGSHSFSKLRLFSPILEVTCTFISHKKWVCTRVVSLSYNSPTVCPAVSSPSMPSTAFQEKGGLIPLICPWAPVGARWQLTDANPWVTGIKGVVSTTTLWISKAFNWAHSLELKQVSECDDHVVKWPVD